MFIKSPRIVGPGKFIPQQFQTTKTPTSLRSQVATKFITSDQMLNPGSVSATRNCWKRSKAKKKRIMALTQLYYAHHNSFTAYKDVACNGKNFFVHENVFKCGTFWCRFPLLRDYNFEKYNDKTFDVVNDPNGAIHYLPNGEISFIKVPRGECMRAVQKHGVADAEVLHKAMNGGKSCTRSTAMSPTFEHGYMVQRGAPGVLLSPVLKNNEELHSKIRHLSHRVQDVGDRFIPRDMLKKFCELRDTVMPFPTLTTGGTSCSVSVAVDHISALHTDQDFFLTYLTARSNFKVEHDYNVSDEAPVAYHFIFPTIGYSVSIWPGDIILFNPCLPNCCGHKMSKYDEIEVYLASFYTKTGHIGGNDNRRSLSTLENDILNNL